MRRPSLRCLAPLCLALVGCAGGEGPARAANAIEVTDSAGVRLTTIVAAPEAMPTWRLEAQPRVTVTGATIGDSTALSLVGPARWLGDGGFVALDLDNQQLVVFDSAGTLRRAMGRTGAGPGEMRSIVTMAVQRGDTITTYDQSLLRLSFWHPASGYVRQVGVIDADPDRLFTWQAWSWQDSLIVTLELGITPPPPLAADQSAVRWQTRASVALRDVQGRTLARSPEFDGMYSALTPKSDARLPYSNLPFVALAANAVHFGSGVDFTIGQLSPAFTVASHVRWPAQREPLTAAEVESVRVESVRLLAERVPLERAQSAFRESFLPELLPAFRPSIGRVLVDDRERLWVERFEPLRLGSPLQTPSTRWTVLAPDGSPVASVQLPPYTRLEDVRADRALVVQRDSSDLEYLAVYRLEGTGVRMP